MFEKARLKLTAWYLVIIMTISLLFSFAVYSSITFEFRKFEKMHVKIQEEIRDGVIVPPPSGNHFFKIGRPDPKFIEESRKRLLVNLGLLNIMILVFSGAAGYFLAGRTLRPIQKMVDEQNRFITDASHELRTPITSLRSEIEVALRNKDLTLSEAKKLLESNLEETVNLQSLSDNLLGLSQLGKPQNTKNMTEVSVVEIVDASIRKLSGLIKKKNIIVQKNVKDVGIRGIPERLTELLVILLDNAVKYSPPKSKISIAAKAIDGKVRIEIKDNGIGIAEEDLPLVFDRFYRGTKSRSKEKVTGYGLGLAMAKEIVSLHSGAIVIKSKQAVKGAGTTVVLEFS